MQRPRVNQVLCKSAALLLRYPCPEWLDHAAQIRTVLCEERPVPAEAAPLLRFIAGLATRSLQAWQALYVQTFDFTAATTLNLTAIAFGEEKDRGRSPQRGYALVQLGQVYEGSGYHLQGGELPDYLPALLEFVAAEGWPPKLAHHVSALLGPAAALARRLERASSPYAPVLGVAHTALADAAGKDRVVAG